ncbi:hypothetical protein MPL3365_230021 [Mesorhizobium plurifarium]|uniref:Uncharacterized protein n=1 Tax=Mesorhizobium plurifarium TaxID=69974 RepID=A0A090G3W4_MESPL|nr:hypothetical protein MPL3365_230021 [Mesorhizobium plurifarium]
MQDATEEPGPSRLEIVYSLDSRETRNAVSWLVDQFHPASAFSVEHPLPQLPPEAAFAGRYSRLTSLASVHFKTGLPPPESFQKIRIDPVELRVPYI